MRPTSRSIFGNFFPTRTVYRSVKPKLCGAGRTGVHPKDPAQKRLDELVSDPETILIQIANLDSANGLSAVEFAKQGAESRGIMLKINLAEMGQGGKSDRRAPQARASII